MANLPDKIEINMNYTCINVYKKDKFTKSRIIFQLANGFREWPIGFLEKVIVTSYAIEYENTFAMVDFGKK